MNDLRVLFNPLQAEATALGSIVDRPSRNLTISRVVNLQSSELKAALDAAIAPQAAKAPAMGHIAFWGEVVPWELSVIWNDETKTYRDHGGRARAQARSPCVPEQEGFNWPSPNLSISRDQKLRLDAIKEPSILPRLVEPRLSEALADSPVVLIHGPRQCGKTTLARMAGEARGYSYFSFDDDVTLAAAQADPTGFIENLPERTILDEVQRAPGLFTALKTAVDQRRAPGRFLLTGSANVLLVPKLADSLAGRMELQRLHPLSQCELGGAVSRFIDALFAGDFKTRKHQRLGPELAQRILAGGYPAALARENPRRRAAWYRDYIETLVQRDVRDLARIRGLDSLPRLLALAAGQTARLVNISDLASPFRLSRPTIHDYVTLLERVFLLELLPPGTATC